MSAHTVALTLRRAPARSESVEVCILFCRGVNSASILNRSHKLPHRRHTIRRIGGCGLQPLAFAGRRAASPRVARPLAARGGGERASTYSGGEAVGVGSSGAEEPSPKRRLVRRSRCEAPSTPTFGRARVIEPSPVAARRYETAARRRRLRARAAEAAWILGAPRAASAAASSLPAAALVHAPRASGSCSASSLAVRLEGPRERSAALLLTTRRRLR